MALRYFNAAGADPDGEIGEDHDPETHLIPLVIGAAHGDAAASEDLRHRLRHAGRHRGPRLRPRHGSGRRASPRAASGSASGTPSQAINLGTGRGHSVREVVDDVSRVGGKAVPAVEVPRRAGDPPELVAAPGSGSRRAGLDLPYPDLDVIVEHAWGWHTKRRR